jgi:hypothetical protein
VSGGDADIIVYDTTTDTSKLHLQGRHFVLSAPRGTQREVVEVFEIENEGIHTVVPRDANTPIWSFGLPAAARGAAVSLGDVAAAAVNIHPGRAELFAPISPGLRQLVLTYVVDADDFPLAQPLGRKTSVLEVLLEEPRASVEGAHLTEVANAAIESRVFRRFLAQDQPPSAIIRVTAPAPVARNQSAMRVLAVVMALAMLGAIGVWLFTRRTSSRAAVALAVSEADRLIAELAALDASFERHATVGGEARQVYEQERAMLKERIARALEAERLRA